MTMAKTGDRVRIHYTGTLEDGSTFDSSAGREPLGFTIGSGEIIPGLDAALPGMSVGERKQVQVPCEAAYGPVNPEARFAVPLTEVPGDIPMEPGTPLQIQTTDGEVMQLVVLGVTEDDLLLDGNHPLAGKDLTFDIELVEIA